MTTISLKIPDDLALHLAEVARARRTSRSALFREALVEKLCAGDEISKASLFERSADLCGIGDSGLGDLASNPDHLKGFGA